MFVYYIYLFPLILLSDTRCVQKAKNKQLFYCVPLTTSWDTHGLTIFHNPMNILSKATVTSNWKAQSKVSKDLRKGSLRTACAVLWKGWQLKDQTSGKQVWLLKLGRKVAYNETRFNWIVRKAGQVNADHTVSSKTDDSSEKRKTFPPEGLRACSG